MRRSERCRRQPRRTQRGDQQPEPEEDQSSRHTLIILSPYPSSGSGRGLTREQCSANDPHVIPERRTFDPCSSRDHRHRSRRNLAADDGQQRSAERLTPPPITTASGLNRFITVATPAPRSVITASQTWRAMASPCRTASASRSAVTAAGFLIEQRAQRSALRGRRRPCPPRDRRTAGQRFETTAISTETRRSFRRQLQVSELACLSGRPPVQATIDHDAAADPRAHGE